MSQPRRSASFCGWYPHAAHDGRREVVRALGYALAHVVDLLGELTRGGDHQHVRALAAAGVVERVHDRKEEGRGLAGAGLGGGEEVVAGQDLGDGLGLDGGGLGVAQVVDGLEHGG
jgi:hypothetical protein